MPGNKIANIIRYPTTSYSTNKRIQHSSSPMKYTGFSQLDAIRLTCLLIPRIEFSTLIRQVLPSALSRFRERNDKLKLGSKHRPPFLRSRTKPR